MIESRWLVAAVAIVSAELSAGTAWAQGYTIYTDRAAFLAATSNPTVQTFDSYRTDVTIPRGFALVTGSLTIDTDGNGTTVIDAPPSTYSFNGSSNLRISMFNGASNTFLFSGPVNSFGADFSGMNVGGANSYFEANGITFTPPTTSERVNNFFGFVSSSPFSSVYLGVRNPNGFAMDNITYGGSAAAAPEPNSWALLILGFGTVAASLRRRQSKPERPIGSVA